MTFRLSSDDFKKFFICTDEKLAIVESKQRHDASDDVLRSPGATIDEAGTPASLSVTRRGGGPGGDGVARVSGVAAFRPSSPSPSPRRARSCARLVVRDRAPRVVAMATQLGAIKRVRGFPGVNVDGFNYQSPDVTAYFLTHYHADHTCGLHAGFKGPAPIYCTPPTAALLTAVTGVRPSLVRAVAVGDDAAVPLADGGEAVVTFLDANHCPGSALLHFRHRSTNRVVLHTGDFRASRAVRRERRQLRARAGSGERRDDAG